MERPSTFLQMQQPPFLRDIEKLYRNKHTSNETRTKQQEDKFNEELKQIKTNFKRMELKSQEELMNLMTAYGSIPPGIETQPGCCREAIKIMINNEFTGTIETRTSDDENKRKNDEISCLKKDFLRFMENHRMEETVRLIDDQRRMHEEQQQLKTKYEEIANKYEEQIGAIQELKDINTKLKSKLEKHKEGIHKDVSKMVLEAEIEKKWYVNNMKQLIDSFQMEKSQIEEVICQLNNDISVERNQHINNIENLRKIIDDYKEEIAAIEEEKARLTAENKKLQASHDTIKANEAKMRDSQMELLVHLENKQKLAQQQNEQKENQINQELEEHRNYCYELEIIIKNLGHDNINLELDNTEMKKRHDNELELLKQENEIKHATLIEELNNLKFKRTEFQDIREENEFLLAENAAVKSSLKTVNEANVVKMRVLSAESIENQRKLNLQIQEQQMRFDNLDIKFAENNTKISELQTELERRDQNVRSLEQLNNSLNNQVQELQSTLKNVLNTSDEKQKQIEDVSQQIAEKYETETREMRDEIKVMSKTVQDLQTQRIEQETLYKITKVDFEEFLLEHQRDAERNEIKKNELIEHYESKLTEMKTQIAELETLNYGYEENETNLHREIQTLVRNMNELNKENEMEVQKIQDEIKIKIGDEVEELRIIRQKLDEQIKQRDKQNNQLKNELATTTARCDTFEQELRALKHANQDLTLLLESSKDKMEDDLERMKLSRDRAARRNNDQFTKLRKEYDVQTSYCDQLEQRKRELERQNKNYNINLEQVTKIYERELSDVKQDIEKTKQYYENKMQQSKTEVMYETKKYENRINELEQELKIVRYEVEWLRDAQIN